MRLELEAKALRLPWAVRLTLAPRVEALQSTLAERLSDLHVALQALASDDPLTYEAHRAVEEALGRPYTPHAFRPMLTGRVDERRSEPSLRQRAHATVERWHPALGLEIDRARREAVIKRTWPCHHLHPTLSAAEEGRAFAAFVNERQLRKRAAAAANLLTVFQAYVQRCLGCLHYVCRICRHRPTGDSHEDPQTPTGFGISVEKVYPVLPPHSMISLVNLDWISWGLHGAPSRSDGSRDAGRMSSIARTSCVPVSLSPTALEAYASEWAMMPMVAAVGTIDWLIERHRMRYLPDALRDRPAAGDELLAVDGVRKPTFP